MTSFQIDKNNKLLSTATRFLKLLDEARDDSNEYSDIAMSDLITHYTEIVKSIIYKRKLFLLGGTVDDLIQEGRIGINKAIIDFNDDAVQIKEGECPVISRFKGFERFLNLCIERQLVTAIKTASRQKHIPINESISFDRPLADNENMSLMDLFVIKEEVQKTLNFDMLPPEDQLILNEQLDYYEKKLDEKLSDTEKAIFFLYRDDYKYKDICEILNIKSEKKIDNGIQRVRKKIEEILENEERELFE